MRLVFRREKIRLEQVYKETLPKVVRGGELKEFTIVYPKFSLGEHQKLKLELSEDKGSRFMELSLPGNLTINR